MIGRDWIRELNYLLEEYRILERDKNDEFIWKATLAVEFSVKSTYKLMFEKNLEPNDWGNVWFNHLILKNNIFWWTTIHGKIVTIDNLIKRGFQISNRCYMCKREEESINHLFLHCRFSFKVWGRNSLEARG